MATSAPALPLPLCEDRAIARQDRLGQAGVGDMPSRGLRQTSGTSLRSADERGPGGPTLDTLLTRLWEGLVAGRKVTCPWCAGQMTPRYGAGPRPVAGRCTDCGSDLR